MTSEKKSKKINKVMDVAIEKRPDLKPFINKNREKMLKKIHDGSRDLFKKSEDVGKKLKQIVQKIEYSNSEKSKIYCDIADHYKWAKSEGFDCKILKKIITLRKIDKETRQEEDYLLETYLEALEEANG